jgi:hypothetical protein
MRGKSRFSEEQFGRMVLSLICRSTRESQKPITVSQGSDLSAPQIGRPLALERFQRPYRAP